jgi:hypothetical protein
VYTLTTEGEAALKRAIASLKDTAHRIQMILETNVQKE